jgi:putative ABC transport system permease protein
VIHRIPAFLKFASLCSILAADAAANLRVKPAKSVLALIGIAMGTAAVIALLHIGTNARAEALRRFQDVGADFLTIQPPIGAKPAVSIDERDVQDMPLPEIGLSGVAPIIQSTVFVLEGHNQWRAHVVGTTKEFLSLHRLSIRDGRFVSELDQFEPFMAIGSQIAAQIAASRGRPIEIGERIRIGSEIYCIIGILAPAQPNPLTGLDYNNTVFTNMKSVRRIVATAIISGITGRLSSGKNVDAAIAAIIDYFRQRLHGAQVQVVIAGALIESIGKQMQIYSALLLAVGGISLLIGGVGIMNVMLMSVMERKEEIGLRAAVGASPNAIRAMFIMESIALAASGSVIGLFLGIAAGWIFAIRSGWQFFLAPTALPAGLGMAIVVGLFFGIYPAHRAASLHPIQALRRE